MTPRPEQPLAPVLAYDPVIEAYKKDIDRTLLRENLKRTPKSDCAGSWSCNALQKNSVSPDVAPAADD